MLVQVRERRIDKDTVFRIIATKGKEWERAKKGSVSLRKKE